MANELSKFQKKLIVRGICDERGLAFCATAKTLPNGEFGMVLIAQNQNTLFIHDTNIKSEALDLLYTINLKKVTDLKINGFFGELFKGYSMRFTYKQFTYTFKNCYARKRELTAIRETVQ